MLRLTLVALTLAVVFSACSSDSDGSSGANARAEARAIAMAPAACTTASDCCRVIDGCMATVLVVSASDRERVQKLVDESDKSVCVACITPHVQVDCVAGQCTAEELPFDGEGYGAVPQCGRVEATSGASSSGLKSGDVGTKKSGLILGCGA